MTNEEIYGSISIIVIIILTIIIDRLVNYTLNKLHNPKPEYKRYMVFIVHRYEEYGGLADCEKDFDKKHDAIEHARKIKGYDSATVFDRIAGIEIKWKPEPVKHIDPREEMLKENREKVFKQMESEK